MKRIKAWIRKNVDQPLIHKAVVTVLGIKRRLMLRTTVIAITGSCGKTSATQMLGMSLADHDSCYTMVERNKTIALLTALRQSSWSIRFLLVEAGVMNRGDMAGHVKLLHPDIGIVTTIGRDHHTSFRSREGTAAEKGLLIKSLPPSGTAVLNADDPYVLGMAESTRAQVLTFGLSESADVRGTDISAVWPNRLSLTVSYQGEQARVQTRLFGDLLVPSVLAAIAGSLAVGRSLTHCAASLEGLAAYPRRMSIHCSPEHAWFINDTFKAPYWTIDTVIDLVRKVEAPRKTIVFGSFSDIPGAISPKYRHAATEALTAADRAVFVGNKALHARKRITKENRDRLFAFDSLMQAFEFLGKDPINGELTYVKSNTQDHLERLIYGHPYGFSCRLEGCDLRINCIDCQELGLKDRVDNQPAGTLKKL